MGRTCLRVKPKHREVGAETGGKKEEALMTVEFPNPAVAEANPLF